MPMIYYNLSVCDLNLKDGMKFQSITSSLDHLPLLPYEALTDLTNKSTMISTCGKFDSNSYQCHIGFSDTCKCPCSNMKLETRTPIGHNRVKLKL